jgi:hypothetical protein
MVPQIRESAYHIDHANQDWLLALGPERQRFQQKEFNDFHTPSCILAHRRKVVFDDQVDVHEVDQIDMKYYNSVWFSESELFGFEQKYDERASTKRSAQERDARAYNHSRRVLLHHQAYKQMGDCGMKNGLEYISLQSSKSCKELSRQDAIQVEQEVRRDYDRKPSKKSSVKQQSGFDYFIDYFMNRFFDIYRTSA